MADRDYVTTVALRSDLTYDDLGEAKRQIGRLKNLQLLDEDTRRGWDIGDDRTLWTFLVPASTIAEAMTTALQITADLFTDVDPHAEVIGLAWTGDSD
jgi:hypothetical protein